MIEAARGLSKEPRTWDSTLVDDILPVKTEDAKDMARRIVREEPSSRGHLPEQTSSPRWRSHSDLDQGPRWSRLMADSGLKYLNSDVYRNR